MTVLNKTRMVLLLADGTRVSLLDVFAYPWAGELAYANDESNPRLWLSLVDEGPFKPVPTLDMAVVNNGNVVTNNGEIVWVS